MRRGRRRRAGGLQGPARLAMALLVTLVVASGIPVPGYGAWDLQAPAAAAASPVTTSWRGGGSLPALPPHPGAAAGSLNGTSFLRNITVGSQPTRAAFDPGNGYLYVTNFGTPPPTGLGNTVSIVRTSNDTVVKTVAVGDDPLFDIYDPSDGFVYVLDYGVSDNLTVINGTTVLASVPVGTSPGYAAYDSADQDVYVANHGSSNVSVVHGLSVVANLPVGAYPSSVVYDSASGDVYVANSGSGNVSVLHGTSIVTALPVGAQPAFMAFDSARATVYVPNSGSGNVSVLDGRAVAATVNTSGTPQAATYDPGSGEVYVPNDLFDTVDVISNTTLVGNVSVGGTPRFPSYDPGNGIVYVPDWASGSVSLLNGTQLVATVTVGVEPYSALFVPANGEVYVPNYGGVNNSALSNVSVLGAVKSPYSIGFSESGLPSGTNWSVAVGHTTYRSASTSFAFNATNGTYPYRVVPLAGYYAENGTGNATVNGSSPRIHVTFLPTWPVTFTESGLPGGTNWSVTLGGVPANSSATQIVLPEPNGTYAYRIGLVPGYHAAVGSGNVSVGGAAVNVSVTFSETVYPLTFVETGLPTGTPWSVRVGAAVVLSSNSTAHFSEPNGSYPFVADAGSAFASPNATGTVNISGGPATVQLPFVAAYPVTFQEVGLPPATPWNVTLGGRTNGSSTSTITFHAPNGTEPFRITPIAGYSTTWSGNVTVAGAALQVDVVFVAFEYGIRFAESGLPAGTTWGVAVNGSAANSSGSVIRVGEPNGSYAYQIGAPTGFRPTVPSGTVVVQGANVTVNVSFFSVYAVDFEESGLPAGTAWGVAVGADAARSNGSAVTLELPNGSHAYRIDPVAGYATNWTGTLDVLGQPVRVNVTFAAFAYPVTFHETGLPGGTGWSVIVGAVQNRSYGTELVLPLPNGTFRYSVGPVGGFQPTNRSGPIAVAGAALRVAVAFQAFTFAVEFDEVGLPPGAAWGIQAGPVGGNSTGAAAVVLELPNGTYNYSVTAPAGYQATGGVVTVAGAAPSPTVVSFSTPAAAPGFLGLPGLLGYALVAGLAAVAAIAVVALLRNRRRRLPPPDGAVAPEVDEGAPPPETPGDEGYGEPPLGDEPGPAAE